MKHRNKLRDGYNTFYSLLSCCSAVGAVCSSKCCALPLQRAMNEIHSFVHRSEILLRINFKKTTFPLYTKLIKHNKFVYSVHILLLLYIIHPRTHINGKLRSYFPRSHFSCASCRFTCAHNII